MQLGAEAPMSVAVFVYTYIAEGAMQGWPYLSVLYVAAISFPTPPLVLPLPVPRPHLLTPPPPLLL